MDQLFILEMEEVLLGMEHTGFQLEQEQIQSHIHQMEYLGLVFQQAQVFLIRIVLV